MKVEKRGRKPSLTAEQKAEIIRLDAEGVTYNQLADMFGVCTKLIGQVVRGQK
jgi:DNA-directed RNA polymerase specialized sigma24 family protein